MPSILSRLLGRRKSQEPGSPADKPGYPTPLLEGKFEAVSPTVSPSAAFFSDPGAAEIRGIERSKDKESPFHVFRARSRPSSDSSAAEKVAPDVPHLSLNLPLTKERGRALDVVFESDPDTLAISNEATIRERRLTPHEALSLVRACSQVILERGLETLGVMHPHWHSASPEVQHRLISLYLLSLASTNRNDATSPTSRTAPATFEYELHYTCSPHDVAAVLRWGLRHLKLDGNSFGKDSSDWTWYNTFTEAERTGAYPPDSFSKFLIPQLPTAHTELLLSTLDIISSLSARCEANGSSGSKLSKIFGLWLLTCEGSTEGDDWRAFYDRWERAGRILEHLFLAKIRNDARSLPRRLTDLVEHYPYDSVVDVPKDGLLPRPRFSTRQYDALFVRLDTEYTGALKPKSHPLRLIADALRAQLTGESATPEDVCLWDEIKKASLISHAAEGSSDAALAEPVPIFSNIFSDETIRLLSLMTVDVSDKDKPAPTFILQSPISPGSPRSFSLPETPLSPVQAERGRSPPSGHVHLAPSLTANNSTAPTTALETPTDWLQFSSHGFGAIPGTRDLVATLWDNDVEVTVPPPAPLSRKSSRRTHSRHSRHSSLDSPRTPVPPLPTVPAISTSKTTLIAKIKLDEAFIDFWADSLLDPISRRWPSFVLCQLKSLPPTATSATPTPAWLVIEQRFVRVVPAPLMNDEIETTVPPARPRASSPRPESSRLSAAFSIASKRFAFFAGGSSDPKSPKEKTVPLPQVGESGDGAAEEVEKLEEAGAEGKVDQGAVPALTTVGATALAVVGAATATLAATQEEITQKPRDNGLPAGTAEIAPSELAGVSAPKADEPVKDEQPHNDIIQDGHAHDPHHDDEQYELKSETVPTPDPVDADPLVSLPVTSKLVKTETEPLVSVAEAETAQPAPTSAPSIPYFAGISEGPPVQAEAAPPEPSVVPVVEEAASVEEIATAPAVPEPAISHASILEEFKSANAPAAEPTLAPVQAPASVIAAAIEEPVVDDTGAAQVAEHDPVVKVKAPEQDLPADEMAPDTEWTRTSEEVPAPAAEPVIVTETPKASLPEESAEDLPIEPTSATAAVPASEQTTPKDDILTTREAQVATSADSEPIIVEDSSATHPDVPTDDVAPAIQTSPIHEGQTTDSIDVVETTAPLEEPAEVAGESVIKEDAQPAAIPGSDDLPKGSDEVEMTSPEPAKEPYHVDSDTTLPALENADSAAEAPAPNDKPDVGHAVAVTQSAEASLHPHDTTRVQDGVIEEQLTAEETKPIPDASTGESTPAGDAATSHDNETDAVLAESAGAEKTPVDEPTTSSEVSPPVLEGAVTEPASEPSTAIAHDDSPADDSAEPAVARAEQANAEATVLMNENGSDELKVQPSIAAESQAITDNSESVLPHEEPSPPAPEASHSVVEEFAPPDAGIPLETPASAAQEPSPNEATAPDAVETPVEAPATSPAESGPVPEDADPAIADASATNPVPAIEEPTPLLEEDVPVTAETPSPLPEEPTPVLETAMPAVETEKRDLTHEQSAPDAFETPLHELGPVVEEGDPIVEEDGPAVEMGGPVVEKDDPILEEDGPVVEKDDPVVKKDDLVAEEVPAAPESPVENSTPLSEDPAPATESAAPTADETPVESPEHDQEGLSTLEPAATAAEETAPATEEQAGLGETAQAEPVVEESLLSEEQAEREEPPSVPGLDATNASEPEAPLAAVDSAFSETTGATDTPS